MILFNHNTDVYLCNVYILPSDSKVLRHDEVDFFELLELGIETYKHLGKLFIFGDLNSHSSNLSDVLHFDRYLDNDDLVVNSSDIPLRVNKDHVIDTNGRRLIDLCKSTGLIIANGRLHKDLQLGEYTYCSHGGMSVVDYLLFNYNDNKCITDFKVLDFNEFSDHAPLYFTFSTRVYHDPTCHTVKNRRHV